MIDNAVAKVIGSNFYAFVEMAFRASHGKRLNSSQLYIQFIVLYLELFMEGKIKKLLVNLPGRHLKTFICSVCFPAFALGLNPSLRFIIVAYSEDIAEDIVRQIREIVESDWYKAAFKTRISDRHSRKDDFAIKGGGRVRAVPVRSVTGKGGDHIILDDPHNAADWENDRQKAKVIEAFGMLVSRRDGGKKSQILVVGHRLAEDDLSAHIKVRGDFKRVRLPLFAPSDMTFRVGDFTWILKKGEALRPDEFPKDEITRIQRFHTGAPFWLYYQQGVGPRGRDFQLKHSHFPFLPKIYGRDLPKAIPVVLSVDPAQKTSSTSRNVIHVYAIVGKEYHFIYAWAEKCSSRLLANKVKFLAQRYRAWFLLIENTARGGDLIEEMKSSLPGVSIVPINPRGSKESRLQNVLPIILAKRVHIRRLDAVEEATDEIVAWPNAPYDDHLDALVNFLIAAPELTPDLPPAPTNAAPIGIGIALGSAPPTVPSRVNSIAVSRPTQRVPSPFPELEGQQSSGRFDLIEFGNLSVKKSR